MKHKKLCIEGTYLVTHEVYNDDRGFFTEWYSTGYSEPLNFEFTPRQANISSSIKGVFRGMHFSQDPEGQSKVVSCAKGSIEDFIIDLRHNSPTFMKSERVSLQEGSGDSLHIPTGVAHGFYTASEFATVVYLTSTIYRPEFEYSIDAFDVELNLNLANIEISEAIRSTKDTAAPKLQDLKSQIGLFKSNHLK